MRIISLKEKQTKIRFDPRKKKCQEINKKNIYIAY